MDSNYNGKKYWYEFRLRGLSPGCQPRDFVDADATYGRFGAVAYDRPLTDAEIEEYELNVIEGESYNNMTNEKPQLQELLEKRKKLVHNSNMIVKEYREKRRTASKKEIKEIKKKYELAREFIYYCEDMIAEISPEELDHVVEPNPENIDDALDLFTDDEWNNMK